MDNGNTFKSINKQKTSTKKPTGHDIHYNLFINTDKQTDRVQIWIVSESEFRPVYYLCSYCSATGSLGWSAKPNSLFHEFGYHKGRV